MTTMVFWISLGVVLLVSLAVSTVSRFHHLDDLDISKHGLD